MPLAIPGNENMKHSGHNGLTAVFWKRPPKISYFLQPETCCRAQLQPKQFATYKKGPSLQLWAAGTSNGRWFGMLLTNLLWPEPLPAHKAGT